MVLRFQWGRGDTAVCDGRFSTMEEIAVAMFQWGRGDTGVCDKVEKSNDARNRAGFNGAAVTPRFATQLPLQGAVLQFLFTMFSRTPQDRGTWRLAEACCDTG